MTYATEFPDFGALPLDPTEFGLDDTSWHNDVSPSFSLVINSVNVETLWINYADPEKREMDEGVRFTYYTYEPSGEHNEPLETLLSTDDVDEVRRFLQERFAQRQSLKPEATITHGTVKR